MEDNQDKPGKITQVLMKNIKGFFPLKNSASSKRSSDDLRHVGTTNDEDGAPINVVPGGWKTMPYIIGNETFERFASFGLMANLTVYLVTRYHMPEMTAVDVNNIWYGTSSFAPIFGAFLADAYWGKYKTIAYGCVSTFLGMVVMTLTAGIAGLYPPACSGTALQLGECQGPSSIQLAVLILSFVLLCVGAAGVRPCNLPFGMDQFDRTTELGRQGTNSFFNWYYTTNTAALIVALTVVVYIQENISWFIGFLIPSILMFIALGIFLHGANKYVYVPPEGSIFSGIAEVLVVAFKKRKQRLPLPVDQNLVLYNPPTNSRSTKLPLTQQYSFLNKAAIMVDGDLEKPWKLATVQRIEEVKCVIRVIPIWISGIMGFVAIGQQWTMGVLQSLTMDRHLGPHFEIPPASLGVFSLLAIVIFLPIYDQIITPFLRKFTGNPIGMTLLQRMGVGIIVSGISMVVAGMIEERRRTLALSIGSFTVPMSTLWLVPQLVLAGLSEAFNAVGQMEFFNEQFPDQLRSIATAFFCCSQAVAGYLTTLVITIVKGKTNWLNDNINAGRLDYFYYLIAAMTGLNLIFFLISAHRYRSKGSAPETIPIYQQEL